VYDIPNTKKLIWISEEMLNCNVLILQRQTEDENKFIKYYNPTSNDMDSWQPPKLPDYLKDANQRDPELIDLIKKHWILPPFTGPIQLNHPKPFISPGHDRSEQGQPTIVNKLLGGKNNGFYVECGAANGELNSNSLLFELYHHWDGLLIEGNPEFFRDILKRKRRAFMLNACLSPTWTPVMLNFTMDDIGGGIADFIPPGQQRRRNSTMKPHVMVQCFPFYSILKALEVSHVNYFSLDIEGPEIAVLKSIPLNETIIDIISIEKRVVDDVIATDKKTNDCIEVLQPYGYHLEKRLQLDIIMSRL
jgi:hypothetical protein